MKLKEIEGGGDAVEGGLGIGHDWGPGDVTRVMGSNDGGGQ